MAAAKTTAVAVKEEKSKAVAGYDYGTEFDGYDEGATADELLIPFLNILQPMSPQVTDGEVEGAKAGLFYNSVTGELYDPAPGVTFQVVKADHMVVEWIPRDNGGGIAGKYDVNDPAVLRLKAANNNSLVKLKAENGVNDLIETFYVYGNILSADGTEVEGFAVIPVKSTHIKAFKTFKTAIQMIKGQRQLPLFLFKTRLTNEKKKNDSGTWWQLKIAPFGANWKDSMMDPSTHGDVLQAGKALFDMVRSGVAKVDEKSEAAGGPGNATDADIPF